MCSSETIFPRLFFTPFQQPGFSVKRHLHGTLSLHSFFPNIQVIGNYTEYDFLSQGLYIDLISGFGSPEQIAVRFPTGVENGETFFVLTIYCIRHILCT